MATISLEQRVASLEAEVAQLREHAHSEPSLTARVSAAKPWWKQIVGTFADDPAFDEAMQLGRDYRESLRPKQSKRKARRNGRS